MILSGVSVSTRSAANAMFLFQRFALANVSFAHAQVGFAFGQRKPCPPPSRFCLGQSRPCLSQRRLCLSQTKPCLSHSRLCMAQIGCALHVQRVHAELDDVLKGVLPIRDESKYPSDPGGPNAPESEPLGTLCYRSAASAVRIAGP